MDALYFKFMLTLDQNINKIASLRLTVALREHLLNEKFPLKADNKLPKKNIRQISKEVDPNTVEECTSN